VYSRPLDSQDNSNPTSQRLGFEGFETGTIVNNQLPGVTISAIANGNIAVNAATVYDSNSPSSPALFWPEQGNALIISSNINALEPDANDAGGTIECSFDEPSNVLEMTYFGFETEGSQLMLYDVRDELIETIPLPSTFGPAIVTVGVDAVKRMVIEMTGSGAIDDILFEGSSNPCSAGFQCFDGFTLTCDSLQTDAGALVALSEINDDQDYMVIVAANVTDLTSPGDPFAVELVCLAADCDEGNINAVLSCNETLLETTGRLDALPEVFNDLPECAGVDTRSFQRGGAYRIGVDQLNAGVTLASHCINVNSGNDVALLLYRRLSNSTVNSADIENLDCENLGIGTILGRQIPQVVVTGVRSDDTSRNFAAILDSNELAFGRSVDLSDLGKVMGVATAVDNPVAFEGGGTLSLEFLSDTEVSGFEVVDFGISGTTVELFDGNDQLISRIDVDTVTNRRQSITLGATGVRRMDVTFSGAGAVDNVQFQPTPDVCLIGWECVDGYEFTCDNQIPLSNSISYDVQVDEDYLVVALGTVVDAANFGDSFSYDVDCRR